MTRSMASRSTRTKAALAIAILPALLVPLVALAASRGGADDTASPSFTREVAPIVQQKCAGCHQAGGIAPFPLATAKQISARAPLIAAAVEQRIMPPWPPGPRSPRYAGQTERTLSASQRATILAWAHAGGKVDGPARRPLPPETAAPSVGS